MSVTSPRPPKPSTVKVCVWPADTPAGHCAWQPVEGADSPLCARHPLIASNDVVELGFVGLAEIVQREGR